MKGNEVLKVKEFILGGSSEFTIKQDGTGSSEPVSYNYKVKRNDNGTCWFVYAETAGEGKLKYHGYIKRDMTFHHSDKGVSLEGGCFNSKAVKGLIWVLRNSEKLPKKVHVLHHGRCSVCGKKLTDEESVKYGIGPTCRKKVGL